MGIIRRFLCWALIIGWALIIYVLASILICIIDIYLGELIAIAIASAIAIALAMFLYWALIIGWALFIYVVATILIYIIDIHLGELIAIASAIAIAIALAMIMVFYSRHNLHRRLSLYCWGYVRPPFMLVIQPRPGQILKFLSNTFFKPKNPGPPPFKDYDHACYLWPDRLRWHFLMIALLIEIILRIDGAWRLALVVAIFLVLIIPGFAYQLLRRPVLESLWRTWPPFMDKWFKGLADLEIHCIKAYFPPFSEKWDAVYWSPQGSPRDSLLRAAINEMFSAVGEEEISWHHKAFRHWIFYWTLAIE